MKKSLLALFALLTFAVCASTSAVQARESFRFSYKNTGLFLQTQFTGPCGQNTLYLSAFEETQQSAGKPVNGSRIDATLVDACSGNDLYGQMIIGPGTLEINRDLTFGALHNPTIRLFDPAGNPTDIIVDVATSSVGGLFTGRSRYSYQPFPGLTIIMVNDGSSRDAVFNGTITIGGVSNYISGTGTLFDGKGSTQYQYK